MNIIDQQHMPKLYQPTKRRLIFSETKQRLNIIKENNNYVLIIQLTSSGNSII